MRAICTHAWPHADIAYPAFRLTRIEIAAGRHGGRARADHTIAPVRQPGTVR